MTDHRAVLAKIKRFDQLIAYLRDEMGWPIARDSFEDVDDLFYDFTADELGIDPKTAAKIESIKRLRPLSPRQPWGIFFIKFEPKRLPVVALRRILGQVALKNRASANSDERAAWAKDDLLFISNYGEGDERQISFAHFSQAQDGHDLPTLKVLGWDNLDTALHLDAVAEKLTHDLAWPDDDDDVETWRKTWRAAFTLRHREVVTTSKELSIRLAELARAIRDRIKTALAIETDKGPLTKLMKAFKEALVHDLDAGGFADMYAQTIAYGLLSARIVDPQKKTADDFAGQMRTNPFLRELMDTFLKVGGRRGKAGGPGIDFDELGVSEVVDLLDNANMEAVVRDFGDRNPQEDPVIHFYEDFIKEYDKSIWKGRGVIYTPRPVVSYIVRSVDELLRTEFGLEDGLADITTWGEMAKRHKGLKIPDGVPASQAFVQILDPATGTGTFLVETIDLIHNTLLSKWKLQGHDKSKIDELWNEYVPKHLLTRLHAYELLMAPYAIAHLKIGLKLYETGYRFGSDERARIYLTNALEPASDFSGRFEFAIPALANEAAAVNEIKRHKRFTVVIGNPPYSKSMSKHPWSLALIEKFKAGLSEKKSDLTREEWKFLSFAYFNIKRATVGIAGVVINNAFLSAPTHRGIRRFLLEASSKLEVLDLHGDSRKGETSPDGSFDENVFEIQQGVCIALGTVSMVTQRISVLGKADIYGTKEHKYEQLSALSAASTQFIPLSPQSPLFFFRKSQCDAGTSYADWTPITEIFLNSNTGIQTKNDDLFTDISASALRQRMQDVLENVVTNRIAICHKYGLKDSVGWHVSQLNEVEFDELAVQPFLYKPFDHRFIYYNRRALGRARYSTMWHMLQPNLALIATRQVTRLPFCHAFVSRWPIEEKTGSHDRTTQLLPLYIYPEEEQLDLGHDNKRRTSSLSPAFTAKLSSALGVRIPEARDLTDNKAIGPEQVFLYIYAILYSPDYRERFGHELMGDFPRLPLTGNLELFRALAWLGGELVALHLVESPKLDQFITTYNGPKNPEVLRVGWSNDTVWLDAAGTKKGQPATPGTIGFRGVPEAVWNFHIGGYQVCEKWLKDRKGRTLSKDDIAHYQKIVVALAETIRLMQEIDEVIEKHGGWPGAFASNISAEKLDGGSSVLATPTPIESRSEPSLFSTESIDSPSSQPTATIKAESRVHPESEENAAPPIDSLDKNELICAIRHVLQEDGEADRDELIRRVAQHLRYRIVGSNIRDRISDAIRTAVRRQIADASSPRIRIYGRNISEYDRGHLKEQLCASLAGSAWHDRDDAVRGFARWMGFSRTGTQIDDTSRSLINGLIREDRLETRGTEIRRR